MQVGQQLFKNILSSWLGYVVRLVISFLFIPYITSVFGDARYGIWVIIFQTIGYFSLLDMGLSSALTRFVSRHLTTRDFGAINRVLNTATMLYFAIGTVAFCGIYLFVHLFFDYFRISSPAMIAEGKTALTILGIYVAFSFYLAPFGNSMAAFQRHDVNRYLAICEEIVRVVLMVWVIRMGHGLVALAIVVASVSLLKHVVGAAWLKKRHPEIRFSPSMSDGQTTGTLFRYSRIAFGITVGWLFLFNTDTLLLGFMTSSAAAGVYHPASQIMLYLRNLINAIGVPLIPAVSHLETTQRLERIQETYLKGIKYVSYVSAFFATGVVFYAQPFIDLWLPPEFANTATVMMILSIGTAVFLPQIVGNSILFAIEKHRYILYVLLIEVVSKLALAFLLVPSRGIEGMALANTIPQVVLYFTLYPVLITRALDLAYGRAMQLVLRYAALSAFITGIAAFVLRTLIDPTSWPTLGLHIVIITALTGSVGYGVSDKDDRMRLRSALFSG